MPILQLLSGNEDLLSVVDDENGFDLMQHAIIADRKFLFLFFSVCP